MFLFAVEFLVVVAVFFNYENSILNGSILLTTTTTILYFTP